jgi:uncharacterized protein YjiS (DUF1127 family)
MSTVANLRAHAPAATGAAARAPANGGCDGPCPRQNNAQLSGSGPPADEDWLEVTLKSYHVALHPGLRWPAPAAEVMLTWRFVARTPGRLVLWSCSVIAAGMRAIGRWWLERRIAATLERLDDAILKDIGICRSEIPYVARTQISGKWRA